MSLKYLLHYRHRAPSSLVVIHRPRELTRISLLAEPDVGWVKSEEDQLRAKLMHSAEILNVHGPAVYGLRRREENVRKRRKTRNGECY